MSVPAPLAAVAQVTHDPATRSLLVKVSGVGATFWRRGHAALMEDSYSAPTVLAHAPGRRDLARGEAVADNWVRFRLSDADYRRLAGDPDLHAIAVVDKAGRILSVRFLNRAG